MQCTRPPPQEEQREELEMITTATVISEEESAVEQFEPDQSIRLIPDCLEHIFKYLSTSDKGRVAQVREHRLDR